MYISTYAFVNLQAFYWLKLQTTLQYYRDDATWIEIHVYPAAIQGEIDNQFSYVVTFSQVCTKI